MKFGHLDKQRVICDVITGEARSVAIFLSPRFLTFVASDGFLVSVNGILFDGITDDTEPTPLRNERVENRCAVVNRQEHTGTLYSSHIRRWYRAQVKAPEHT